MRERNWSDVCYKRVISALLVKASSYLSSKQKLPNQKLPRVLLPSYSLTSSLKIPAQKSTPAPNPPPTPPFSLLLNENVQRKQCSFFLYKSNLLFLIENKSRIENGKCPEIPVWALLRTNRSRGLLFVGTTRCISGHSWCFSSCPWLVTLWNHISGILSCLCFKLSWNSGCLC